MKKTIEKIVNYAAILADPDEIILFGSMAGVSANEFSDIDLLIICKSLGGKTDVRAKLFSFAHEISLKIDIVLYEKPQLEAELLKPNSFIAAVYNAGKIVYKKGK